MKKTKKQKAGKPIARIAFMTASGCLVVLLAGQYKTASPQDASKAFESTYIPAAGAEDNGFIERVETSWRCFLDDATVILAQTRKEREERYEPSVLKFNLMESISPDDGEMSRMAEEVTVKNFRDGMEKLYRHFAGRLSLPYKTQPQDTEGGQIFEALSRRDAEWTSTLYRWIQATPEQAAVRQKLPLTAVEGGYDPTNPGHDPADPATWLVPNWKNVRIEIYDGDGRPIELYSNAQAIASLASVYTYYTGWEDAEQFKEYADRLWDASHSYSVSLSSVYYCEGCVDPEAAVLTVAESAQNGVFPPEAEDLPIDASNGQETAPEASGEGELPMSPPETAEEAGTGQNISPAGGAQTAAPPAADPIAVYSAAPSLASPQAAQESLSHIQAITIALAAAAAQAGPQDGAADSALTTPESAPAAVPADATPAPPAADAKEHAGADINANTDVNGAGTTAENGAVSGTGAPLMGIHPIGAEVSGTVPAKTAELHLNEEGKFCPGHVDLTIKAKITGLTEQKNLFRLAAPKKGGGWNGWDAYTKAYAKSLYAQDWSEEYGLSLTELAIGKPLTAEEINRYMAMLPADTSNERRAVIAYALNSVGKIPYYYGGKAKAPGYENNTFCTLSLPDRKGRILTGLDCSGWVNWVYWSVTGEAPTVFGTSGLVRAGRAVSREELRPGDIMARLGTNAHVMMFLGWTEDHSMICIHETGGSTGNVTVSVTNVHWPYYRALLD